MTKAMSLLRSLVLLLSCCTHSIQGVNDQRPVVRSRYVGIYYGRERQSDNGARVNEFLGVPYAEPPVGDLRFKKPVKVKQELNRNDTIEADKMPPACVQYSEQPLPWYDLEPGQSEDCLYLNIWAPADIGKKLRPLKIYIHGGGWFDGGSIRMPYYDGFAEAVDTMDEDGNSKEDGLVVVTVNYRLGALGFFASYNDAAPGNVGLNDIVEACYWVGNHIEDFGGQRRNMTLVGQGTGAILASLARMVNSNHYKMILNGATFLTLNFLEGVDGEGDSTVNNVRLADLLSKALGCGPLRESKLAIACLKGVEASRLMRVAASLSRGRGPPNVFLPQIQGNNRPYQFLNPYYMLNKLFYINDYDYLFTFTKDDGSSLLTTAFPKVFGAFGEKNVPLSAACAKKVAKRFLKKFPITLVDDLLGDLDQHASFANRDKLVQVFGDTVFNCPIVFYAEELRRIKEGQKSRSKIYILEKQVNPPYNPWASWMGSVEFDNAQFEFGHPDGQLTVNNQTYKYTDKQSEQVRINQEQTRSFMTGRELPIPQFSLEDPAYGVFDSDGKLSDEKKSNFHSHNCDLLRPYYDIDFYAIYYSRTINL